MSSCAPGASARLPEQQAAAGAPSPPACGDTRTRGRGAPLRSVSPPGLWGAGSPGCFPTCSTSCRRLCWLLVHSLVKVGRCPRNATVNAAFTPPPPRRRGRFTGTRPAWLQKHGAQKNRALRPMSPLPSGNSCLFILHSILRTGQPAHSRWPRLQPRTLPPRDQELPGCHTHCRTPSPSSDKHIAMFALLCFPSPWTRGLLWAPGLLPQMPSPFHLR